MVEGRSGEDVEVKRRKGEDIVVEGRSGEDVEVIEKERRGYSGRRKEWEGM